MTVGVDLAISKSDKADYTAIVPIRAISYDESYFIYVLTPIINKRLNFPEAVETIKIDCFNIYLPYILFVKLFDKSSDCNFQ